MKKSERQIILFDGVCNLCNGGVNFIIRRDLKARFRFAPLQSDTARKYLNRLGTDASGTDTVVFIEGDRYWVKSTAVLRILYRLGGIWRLFYVFMVVPRVWRDAVYIWIAKRRYFWFGKRNGCMIPDRDISDRFL